MDPFQIFLLINHSIVFKKTLGSNKMFHNSIIITLLNFLQKMDFIYKSVKTIMDPFQLITI